MFMIRRMLMLVVVVALVAGCETAPKGRIVAIPAGALSVTSPCAGNTTGYPNPQAPIICVDDTGPTIAAYPPTIYAHESRGPVPGSRRPVPIQWYTASGEGDLKIKAKRGSEGCFTRPDCNQTGHCIAYTIPRTANGKACDYEITRPKLPPLDPTIVITTCCT